MELQHVAVDGATVAISSDGAISTAWSSMALFRIEGAGALFFTNHCVDHLGILREHGPSSFPHWDVISETDREVAGQRLSLALIRQPTVFGESRFVRLAVWEGSSGCIQASKTGKNLDAFARVLARVPFRDRGAGAFVDRPAVVTPRPLRGLSEVVGVGVLEITPAIPEVMANAPASGGIAVRGGRMFRSGAHRSVDLYTETAKGRVRLPDHLDVVPHALETLRIDWRPAR